MEKILIGTKNAHKQRKLSEMAEGIFLAEVDASLPDVEERGDTFEEIARNKAAEYSLMRGGLAISTDGGAVFPALKGEWNPLRTKRFTTGNDEERINALLSMMEGKDDRTVEWHEAVAVARDGAVLFSATARAMDGIIAQSFDPKKYQEGIWLCAITEFPQFGGRNYFELSPDEKDQGEDSWTSLGAAVRAHFGN